MKTLFFTLFVTLLTSFTPFAQNKDIKNTQYMFAYLKDGDSSNIDKLIPSDVFLAFLIKNFGHKAPQHFIDSLYNREVRIYVKNRLAELYKEGKELSINWDDIMVTRVKYDTMTVKDGISVKQTVQFKSGSKGFFINIRYNKLPMTSQYVLDNIASPGSDMTLTNKIELSRKYRNQYIQKCSEKMGKKLAKQPTMEQQAKLNGKCDCSFDKLSEGNSAYIDKIEKTILNPVYLYYYNCASKGYIEEKALKK